jgi:salicylate hydroxylase
LAALPRITELIGGADGWTQWPIRTMPAPGPHARGAAVLIGDAAHAMLPYAAQGAAMAIEDATVLARYIADTTVPMSGRLARAAAERAARTAAVADFANRNGRIYHLPRGLAWARNAAIRGLGGARILQRSAWIYGWHDDD